MPAFLPPSRARVRRIRDRLRQIYGVPLMAPHGDPVAELILTVLSQSTNDRNRDVAYLGLRERFSSWAEVRDAPLSEVELAIRPGGISKVKSARIQAILGDRRRAPARFSLDGWPGRRSSRRAISSPHCRGRPEDRRLRPSVRARPARCSRRHACLPRRHRLGLLPAGASFEELHDRMLALTPPGEELELHVNLLRHGRRTCFARSPACARCALARMCPSRGIGGG